jgi:hypothetical protein
MNFEAFLKTLKDDLREIAQEYGQSYAADIIESGTAFAQQKRNDLIRRTEQLRSGELSPEDFKWLLESDQDLIEMKALEQKGLSAVQLHRIRNAIQSTLATTIGKFV